MLPIGYLKLGGRKYAPRKSATLETGYFTMIQNTQTMWIASTRPNLAIFGQRRGMS